MSDVIKQIVKLRKRVCPRTSYITNGKYTDVLTVISSKQNEYVTHLKSIQHEFQHEFNSINEQTFSSVIENPGGIILIILDDDDISFCINMANTLKRLCPLVCVLISGPIPDMRCETDVMVDVIQIDEFHLLSLYDKNNKQLIGDNEQPPVCARFQFKYLWSNSSFQTAGKQRVLQRITDKKSMPMQSDADWDQLITSWINMGLNDADIYSNIRKYTLGTTVEEELLADNTDDTDDTDNTGRNNYMVDKIMKCIPYRSVKNIDSYLDYGCAEGAITADVGNRLRLSKDKVFGADIRSLSSEGYTFIQLKSENEHPPLPNTILPQISNASISLITCSMVMHHVRHPLQTMQELRRVIKPNGYLIIREHQCENSEMATVLDIVHGLYSLSWSTPVEWPNFIDEYRARYLSQTEMDDIAYQAGFQRIAAAYLQKYHKVNSYVRQNGKITNLTQAYYAVYIPIRR